MANNNFKKVAIGSLIAGVAGYVAGILTAPKSGAETRKDIKDAAELKMSQAERELKKLHTELLQLIDESKKRSHALTGKAKKEWDNAIKQATIVKQKAREILSAVHEGDANDKDLERALKEADKAIKHLQTFLKKK